MMIKQSARARLTTRDATVGFICVALRLFEVDGLGMIYLWEELMRIEGTQRQAERARDYCDSDRVQGDRGAREIVL